MTTFAEFKRKENAAEHFSQTWINLKDFKKYTVLDYVINEVIHGFVVISVFGFEDKTPMYEYTEENGAVEGTVDLDNAEIFLHGSIKWDGCSNWHFDEQDNCMLHFCGEKHAVLLGEIMKHAYKIASENINRFEG